jgi:membrane protein insertase Oxa1/YidC/SpoIIIJ
MLPLDFLNRYFTKKNQLMMKKFAPEEENLKQIYANDPIALAKARREMYRKNGGGQAGFCVVMLVNLVVTLIVFLQVFSALGAISNLNINKQMEQLHGVYQSFADKEDPAMVTALNEKYDDTVTSFLWVKNIWRADTFWTEPMMTWDEYKAIKPSGLAITEEEYKDIYNAIKTKNPAGNGWLLLVVLAGAVTYGSTVLTMYFNNKNAPKKTAAGAGTKTEPIISYSLRDAKLQQQGGDVPQVDPQQVTKIMQYIMPAIMIMFAISSTSAMAIYIISSSTISMGLSFGLGFLIDLILKHQKPKEEKDQFDPTVINPHAKYFKGKQ